MSVAVLVPRRSDGGVRDQSWAWIRDRWEREHPEFKVVEGHHDEGWFNRSAAINRAREQVDADILIVADADTFVPPDQIHKALEAVEQTGRMTLAYDLYHYLSERMSQKVMAGFDGNWNTGVSFTMQGTCSCMVAVTADLFDECGGFDEGFVGWGGEDVAFSLACQTFGNGYNRIPGDVWHLWHPAQPRDPSDPWAPRMDAYRVAAYNAVEMRALIDRIKDRPL